MGKRVLVVDDEKYKFITKDVFLRKTVVFLTKMC